MTIQPGRNLLNYELAEQIGEGGMGVVWRARDTKLDRDVAIKILPADFAQDRDRLARFEREAKLLASLNHANIATIHGLEHDSGLHFLAMELIEGEELATRIGRGAIPVEEALPLARQIASALEAAHERGVIHRDLKPANIKITPEGSVKVLDFGLAKALVDSAEDAEESLAHSPTLTAATRAGVILGTAGYMSPEQARGKPVNKRTDIWAFGCVLYEMLTGRQAFEGETVSDVIAKILEREPDWQELPVQTPLKIRELVLRCVRRDHRDRLHDIADARIEIDEVLAAPSDRVATSRGSSGDEAVSQRPARHVLPWTIAVLVSLLAGLLGMRLLQLTPRDLSPEWFAIVPPNSVSSVGPEPAVSPDGRTVAFRALNDEDLATLWVRPLGSASAR
jgi:serine/threonine protein kinase